MSPQRDADPGGAGPTTRGQSSLSYGIDGPIVQIKVIGTPTDLERARVNIAINGAFVVLVLVFGATLRAIDYVSGFPHCNCDGTGQPARGEVHVLAEGNFDCGEPANAELECEQACGDCYSFFIGADVLDCQDYNEPLGYMLQCFCSGYVEG